MLTSFFVLFLRTLFFERSRLDLVDGNSLVHSKIHLTPWIFMYIIIL